MRINPAPIRDPFFTSEPHKPYNNTWVMWFEEAYKRLQGYYDFIKLSTSPQEIIPTTPGTFWWNSVDGTADLKLLNDSTLQIGQELHFYAKADGNIDNGKLCMFAGAQGDHIKVKQVGASDAATIRQYPHYIVGIATQPISDGSFGYITWFGKVNGVYTTGWSVGDILYFDSSTGQLTNTEPTVPNNRIIIAAVIKTATGAAENGVILVRPSFEDYPEFVDVPATASSTGKKGMMAIDADYLYVCVATDTWKRTQLLTW